MKFKVPDYMKNVGKSVGYATQDIASEMFPNVKKFGESNSDIAKKSIKTIRNHKILANRSKKAMDNAAIFKHAKTARNNLLKDIKSGKYYNKDRIMKQSSESMGMSGDGEIDDMDFDLSSINTDFDMGDDDVDISEGDVAIAEVTAKSALVTASSINTMGETIAATQVETTEAMIEHDSIKSAVQGNILLERHDEMMNALMGGNEVLSQMQSFNVEHVKQSIDNQAEFYDYTTKALKDIVELLGNTPTKSGEGEEDNSLFEKEGNDYFNKINKRGRFKLDEYIKNVKKNAKNMDEIGILDMMSMNDDVDLIGMMTASPLQAVMTMGMKAMITSDTKESFSKFDKSFGSFFDSMALKLNTLAKDDDSNFIVKNLAKLFGVDLSIKSSVDTSAYNKDEVPLDGVMRKALVNVIPSYLSRILAGITGQDRLVFNYETGKMETAKELKSKYKRDIEAAETSKLTKTTSRMQSIMDESFLFEDREESEAVKSDMKEIMKNYVREAKLFNPHTADYEDLNVELQNGSGSFEIFREVFKTMDRNEQQRFNSELLETRRRTEQEFIDMNERMNESGLANILERDDVGETIKPMGGSGIVTSNDYLKKIHKVLLEGIITYPSSNTTGDRPKFLDERLTKYRRRESGIDTNREAYEDKEYSDAKYKKKLDEKRNDGASRQSINSVYGFTGDDKSTSALIRGKSRLDYKTERSKMGFVSQKAYDKSSTKYEYGSEDNLLAQMATQDLAGKFLLLRDRMGRLTELPNKLMASTADKMDKVLYRVVYGSGDDENNFRISFFDETLKKLQGSFKSLNVKINKKILEPLNNWAFGKEGWVTKTKTWFNSNIRPKIQTLAGSTADFFGMGKDGKVRLGMKNLIGDIRWKIFGTPKTKGGKPNENSLLSNIKGQISAVSDKAKELFIGENGLFTNMKNLLVDRFTEFGNLAFGKKDSFNKIKDKFQEFAPDTIIGGGLGLLGSLLVPGGPLLGTMVGSAVGFASKSDRFKDWLFGAMVDGERTGGVMSKKLSQGIQKHADTVGAGSVLGLLSSFALPGGPLTGMFIGGGLSFLSQSEKFKTWMFGKEDGLIDGKMQEKIKEHAPAGGFGALAGMMTVGGPFGIVGGALLGSSLSMAGATEMFKNKLFGTEGEDGREGGLLGSLKDNFNRVITEPLKGYAESVSDSIKDWFNENVKNPFNESLDPIKHEIKLQVKDMFGVMTDSINNIFEKKVGLPIGELIEEKLINPMKNVLTKIFGGLGKMVGKIIASPFSLLKNYSDDLRKAHANSGTGSMYMSDEEVADLQSNSGKGFFGRMWSRGKEWATGKKEAIGGYTSLMRDASGNLHERVNEGKKSFADKFYGKVNSIKDRFSKDDKSTKKVYGDRRLVRTNLNVPYTFDSSDETSVTDEVGQSVFDNKGVSSPIDLLQSNAVVDYDIPAEASQFNKKTSQVDTVEDISSIRKDVNTIASEVDGQLDGLGYNVEKIKNILKKKLGDANATGIETGRGNKKRKTIRSRVLSLLKSPAKFFKDMGKGLLKGAWEVVKTPFKLLNSVGNALVTSAKAIGTGIKGLTRFGYDLIKGVGSIGATLAKGVTKAISVVAEYSLKTVGNIVNEVGKGLARATGHLISGFGKLAAEVPRAAAAVVDFGSNLVSAGARIVEMFGKGLGFVASKMFGKIAPKQQMKFAGGVIDRVKVVDLVKKIDDRGILVKAVQRIDKNVATMSKSNTGIETVSSNTGKVVQFPSGATRNASGIPLKRASGMGYDINSKGKKLEVVTTPGLIPNEKNKLIGPLKNSVSDKYKDAIEHQEEEEDKSITLLSGIKDTLKKDREDKEDGGLFSDLFGTVGKIATGILLMLPFLGKIKEFTGNLWTGFKKWAFGSDGSKDGALEKSGDGTGMYNIQETGERGITAFGLDGVLGNATDRVPRAAIQKGIKKALKVLTRLPIIKNVAGEALEKAMIRLAPKLAVKIGSKGAAMLASGGMSLIIEGAILAKDFNIGYNQPHYTFSVPMDTNIDFEAKVASGVGTAISKFLIGLIKPSIIANMLLGLLGSESKDDIRFGQTKFNQDFDKYNEGLESEGKAPISKEKFRRRTLDRFSYKDTLKKAGKNVLDTFTFGIGGAVDGDSLKDILGREITPMDRISGMTGQFLQGISMGMIKKEDYVKNVDIANEKLKEGMSKLFVKGKDLANRAKTGIGNLYEKGKAGALSLGGDVLDYGRGLKDDFLNSRFVGRTKDVYGFAKDTYGRYSEDWKGSLKSDASKMLEGLKEFIGYEPMKRAFLDGIDTLTEYLTKKFKSATKFFTEKFDIIKETFLNFPHNAIDKAKSMGGSILDKTKSFFGNTKDNIGNWFGGNKAKGTSIPHVRSVQHENYNPSNISNIVKSMINTISEAPMRPDKYSNPLFKQGTNNKSKNKGFDVLDPNLPIEKSLSNKDKTYVDLSDTKNLSINQSDPSVKNIDYSAIGESGVTVGDAGCAPAVATMAVNDLTSKGIGIQDAVKFALSGNYKVPNDGTRPEFFIDYARQHGISTTDVPLGNKETPRMLIESLLDGDNLVLMGEGGPFGSNPHYMLATGIDENGNVEIKDPGTDNDIDIYPFADVLSNSSKAILHEKGGFDLFSLLGKVGGVFSDFTNDLWGIQTGGDVSGADSIFAKYQAQASGDGNPNIGNYLSNKLPLNNTGVNSLNNVGNMLWNTFTGSSLTSKYDHRIQGNPVAMTNKGNPVYRGNIRSLGMTNDEFIRFMYPIADKAYDKYGVLPSLTIAQAALESGYGRSVIGNNLFGHKASNSWKGPVINTRTKEFENGKMVSQNANFKHYNSLEESVMGYAKLLSGWDNYSLAANAQDAYSAISGLSKAPMKYATDPAYYDKLNNITNKWNLSVLNDKAKQSNAYGTGRDTNMYARGVRNAIDTATQKYGTGKGSSIDYGQYASNMKSLPTDSAEVLEILRAIEQNTRETSKNTKELTEKEWEVKLEQSNNVEDDLKNRENKNVFLKLADRDTKKRKGDKINEIAKGTMN